MEASTDLFINLIQNNRIIYDKSLKDFKNTVKKDEVWTKIANQCRMTVESAKKKYQSLRQKYSREKRILELKIRNKDARPVRYWPYYERLNFLNDFIQPRATYTNDTNFNDELGELGDEGDDEFRDEVRMCHEYNMRSNVDLENGDSVEIRDEDNIMLVEVDENDVQVASGFVEETTMEIEEMHGSALNNPESLYDYCETIQSEYSEETTTYHPGTLNITEVLLPQEVASSNERSPTRPQVDLLNPTLPQTSSSPHDQQTLHQSQPTAPTTEASTSQVINFVRPQEDLPIVPLTQSTSLQNQTLPQTQPTVPATKIFTSQSINPVRVRPAPPNLRNTLLLSSTLQRQTPTSIPTSSKSASTGVSSNQKINTVRARATLPNPKNDFQQTSTSLQHRQGQSFPRSNSTAHTIQASTSSNSVNTMPTTSSRPLLPEKVVTRNLPSSTASVNNPSSAERNMEVIRNKMDNCLSALSKKISEKPEKSPHTPFLAYLGTKLPNVPKEKLQALEREILDLVDSVAE